MDKEKQRCVTRRCSYLEEALQGHIWPTAIREWCGFVLTAVADFDEKEPNNVK